MVYPHIDGVGVTRLSFACRRLSSRPGPGNRSVGSNEPRFYDDLVNRLGLDSLPDRDNCANWPLIRENFTAVFKTRTRDEWTALLADSEACFAPVLTMAEAPGHPHKSGAWHLRGSG